MKKTLTINLNQTVFSFEEDAYQKLDQYLNSVNKYFADNPDKEEIISDIETRAAEKFSQKLSRSKTVINLKDINSFITSMGTVEAISGEESISAASGKTRLKHLFRDPDNRIIAGVASGIAAYFGIDPTLVRLIFIILIFALGFSIWFYPLLWLIIPLAKTAAEKVEMKGKPVTLANLQAAINNKFPQSAADKEEGGLVKALLFPFKLLGRSLPYLSPYVKKILPLLLKFTGLLMIFSAVIVSCGLIFIISTLVINIVLPPVAYPAVAAAVLILMIPIIFLLLLGISCYRRKSVLSVFSILGLLTVWLLSVTCLLIAAVNTAPLYLPKMVEAIKSLY